VRSQDSVDLDSIVIRGKQFNDKEDLLPVCYRCSATNPALNNQGNCCTNCHQPFVYSFVTFEILPLIEFFLEPDITDAEAMSLLELEPQSKLSRKEKRRELKATITGESQRLEEEYATMFNEKQAKEDPFTSKLMTFEQDGGKYRKIVVGREVLRSLSRTEVIVCHWSKPLTNQYFKVVMLDVQMIKCVHCNKIFHTDDYKLLALQYNRCPYCRTPLDD